MIYDYVMLDDMNAKIFDAHVKVGFFHAKSIFFYEIKGPLNVGSEWFKLLADKAKRHYWPRFFVSVLKICPACVAKYRGLFDILT